MDLREEVLKKLYPEEWAKYEQAKRYEADTYSIWEKADNFDAPDCEAAWSEASTWYIEASYEWEKIKQKHGLSKTDWDNDSRF